LGPFCWTLCVDEICGTFGAALSKNPTRSLGQMIDIEFLVITSIWRFSIGIRQQVLKKYTHTSIYNFEDKNLKAGKTRERKRLEWHRK